MAELILSHSFSDTGREHWRTRVTCTGSDASRVQQRLGVDSHSSGLPRIPTEVAGNTDDQENELGAGYGIDKRLEA